MIVLGIETSCDETAVGIVQDGSTLLANEVSSSIDLHVAYGGVVPEIAARSHIEVIIPVVEAALKTAFPDEQNPWDRIDAITATYGAGLGGSLLVGVLTARTLAILKNKPLFPANHVLGHVFANFLTESKLPNYALPTRQPQFPMLALIVSGGHTQLAVFKDFFDYTLLGKTRDDAVGEAFDKVAKIIGLPYPGGPSVSAAAVNGDAQKYRLPIAKLDSKYEFSFSGLKTAVLRLAQEQIGQDFTFPSYRIAERLSEAQRDDIAASFQRTAIKTLVDKVDLAIAEFNPGSLVIAGGVAANQELRRQLRELVQRIDSPPSLEYTDIKLCTDNGAMIATLGCFMAEKNQPTADPYSLSIDPSLKM